VGGDLGASHFVVGRDLSMSDREFGARDFGLLKNAALLCRVAFLQRDAVLPFLPKRLIASGESADMLLGLASCFSGLSTGWTI